MHNIITFMDHIGRTLIGEILTISPEGVVRIKNPAQVSLQQNPQNQQLQVQIFPIFFSELMDIETREAGTTWDFNKNNIVMSDTLLDKKLVEQYKKIFEISARVGKPKAPEDNVIKLFDEPDKY